MLLRISSIFFIAVLLSISVCAQVQMQTGSGNFSISMFNWEDDKSNLKTFVSLVYNSGNGLKVSEVASNVGQGWNLISGGMITRMQAGEPDDQVPYNGNGSPGDISRYPAGFLYAQNPAGLGYPENLKNYPIYRTKNHQYAQRNDVAEDKQLDYFYFQFNGKSGVFVIDTLGDDKGVALNDERIKITFQLNTNLSYLGSQIRTSIQSFTIQDVDGLKYKFATLGIAKILKTKYSDRNFSGVAEQPKFKNNKVYYQTAFHDPNYIVVKPWIVGSWYLTEIEDPLTQRKIIFNYTPTLIDNLAGDEVSFMSGKKDYAIVNRKKIYTYTQEISSVTMPDGHVVDFVYGNNRLDYNGYKALAAVDIKYNSRYLSKYKLNTSYIILRRYGTPQTEEQKRSSRLCLMSVQRYGVDLKEEAPPYKFDYHLGSGADDDIVPPYFTFLKDNWGYYNGFNSRGYKDAIHFLWINIPIASHINIDAANLNANQAKGLCFLQDGLSGVYINPKAGYAKNGLLKQVVLPTGGTVKYNYQQNQGVLNGVTQNVGGVYVSSTEVTDGGYTNGCSNPLVTNYNYVLNGGTQSSLWGIEMPSHSIQSSSSYAPESRYYQWNPFKGGLFGNCDFRFKYPGIPSVDQGISLNTFQQIMNVVSPALNIISNIMTVANIVTLATGGGGGIAVAIDIAVQIITLAISCIEDFAKNFNNTVYFNADLNSINPLPMQFKRVEVTESSGGNGKTIHEFTNTDDLPLLSEPNPALSSKQRFFPWAYGLPKKIIYKDNADNVVKQIENTYEYLSYGLGDINGKGLNFLQSAKFKVNKSYSQRDPTWISEQLTFNNQSTSDVTLDIYKIQVGQARLLSTSEKHFQTGNSVDYTENITRFTYPLFRYQYDDFHNSEISSIQTINSNGDQTFKYFSYSDTYTGGIFDLLKLNHIISLPVSVTTNFRKNSPSANFESLDEKKTSYIQVSTGDIKPYQILERRYKKPNLLNGGTPPPPFTVAQTYSYGLNSKLLGIVDEGGRRIQKMYDYNDKFVVAEIINAGASGRILYTSFENSNNTGEWTISGITSFTIASNVTGSRVFTLIPGQNSVSGKNLYENQTNPFRLSFWASGSNFQFSTGGATLLKSGPVKNGYTYYEYKLTPSTTTITIAASGTTNVNIDELRCYPMNARMSTTTYDPLIGKTSECDVNNRITYYEYDNLSRLLFIRDADKNIVKAYEYNNVSESKLRGCPVTYFNNKISEDFRKTNCGPGYMGGLVTYTVPAKEYSSALSQEDADLKAEQELLANGQANANASTGPGSCLQIFYNTAVSRADTTETCGPGYIPGTVTYTVPAGKYSSTINQADADEQAQDDLDANSQHYANTHPNCTYSTQPFWEMVEPQQTQCLLVNGTPHLFYLAKDVNPNSPTYNQTSWKDSGPGNCTVTNPPTVYAKLFYENISYNGYSEIGDVIIRFFSDAACTQPLSVNNLNLNYSMEYSIYYYVTGGFNSYTTNSSVTANGTEYIIGTNLWLYNETERNQENWNYFILPGTGYTIVH